MANAETEKHAPLNGTGPRLRIEIDELDSRARTTEKKLAVVETTVKSTNESISSAARTAKWAIGILVTIIMAISGLVYSAHVDVVDSIDDLSESVNRIDERVLDARSDIRDMKDWMQRLDSSVRDHTHVDAGPVDSRSGATP